MITNINVHITSKCNFDCDVCFENRAGIDLDKDKLLAFIDDIQPNHVGFVGGDPLCHPQINEILQELKVRNIDSCVVSNGELLEHLTVLPDTLSIGIDNYDQTKVDLFLKNYPEYAQDNVEITITPTNIKLIDGLIFKYDGIVRNINISSLAFWDRNPAVSQYITPEYIAKLVELKKAGKVNIWGENDIEGIYQFYDGYVCRTNKYQCAAPLNIYSDGHIEWCDLENFPTGMTINYYNKALLTKDWAYNEKCKCCNLRRKVI